MRIPFLITLMLLAACTERNETSPPAIVDKNGTATVPSPAVTPLTSPKDSASEAHSRLLKRYAATYDYGSLLNEPVIKEELRLLLGPEHKHFTNNMLQLRFPIDVISGGLSAGGARNDLPVRENAVLCVKMHPLQVEAGLFSDNQMTIYARQTEYRLLSGCIHQWVFMQTTDTSGFSTPPAHGTGEFTFQHKSVR